MSCFPCFSSADKKSKNLEDRGLNSHTPSQREAAPPAPARPIEYGAPKGQTARQEIRDTGKGVPPKGSPARQENNDTGSGSIAAHSFTFRELASATKNFRQDCLIREGGFGRVYKGFIENNTKVVAVKQLDKNGIQGNSEFLVEVLALSLLHHPNLVDLVGYCADGEQRLLVYEYMPLGSLEDHLLDLPFDRRPLSWTTRMKIATGAAQGLEYLHEKANPPVIYRDLKSSNILLDEEYNPKLSDSGLTKLGPGNDKVTVSSRVMGTYGYCTPEYARNGQLTLKSDVYSFGVVLLELISGRKAVDPSKPVNEQNLVTWSQPIIEQKRFEELVDPLLDGDYPTQGVKQAVAVAAMCLQEEPTVRPLMTDVVVALSFLTVELPGAKRSGPSGSPPPSSHSSETDEVLHLGHEIKPGGAIHI